MRTPRRILPAGLVLSGLIGATAFAAAPVAPPAPPPLTLQQRIDALLKHRLKPEPLPVNPPNPFQMNSGLRRDPAPEDAVTRASSVEELTATLAANPDNASKEPGAGPSPSEVLVNCARKLNVGGIIVLKDQIQLVVNGTPRKEGDLVAADWNNTIIYLRIVRLMPGYMILRYGDAEATIKF